MCLVAIDRYFYNLESTIDRFCNVFHVHLDLLKEDHYLVVVLAQPINDVCWICTLAFLCQIV